VAQYRTRPRPGGQLQTETLPSPQRDVAATNGRCWQMLDRNGVRTASRSPALLRQPSLVRTSICHVAACPRATLGADASRSTTCRGPVSLFRILSGTRPSLLGDVDRRADSRRHGRGSLRHRSNCSARWRGSSPRSRCSTMKATVRRRIDALNGEIAKVNATAVEGGPRRASARWTSIRSWRVGVGPARQMLSSSPVSRPPRSDDARSSGSRSNHCPG
jgi:hypothetical protein